MSKKPKDLLIELYFCGIIDYDELIEELEQNYEPEEVENIKILIDMADS